MLKRITNRDDFKIWAYQNINGERCCEWRWLREDTWEYCLRQRRREKAWERVRIKRGNGKERKQILHFMSYISLMYSIYDIKTKERLVEWN